MQLKMRSKSWLLVPLLLLINVAINQADCIAYSPTFPIPVLDKHSNIIQQAKHEINAEIQEIISASEYDTTSFSIAVTSSTEDLFELHHTARDRDPARPGAETTNGDTCYRIASCTKPFTVLALLQQQKAGALNLDDPITKYIAELNGPDVGPLPWKDITLRTLASQLSGIPRDLGMSDMLITVDNPIAHGLPSLSPSDHHETHCDSLTNFTVPCTKANLLERLFDNTSRPIFPPKQQSTYSNLNFELLALALENITSTPYETLIQDSILTPLELTSTSFSRPSDSVAALPKDSYYYWDVVMGIQSATGGLYSSSTDLSKFLRYVLTHYNGLTPALNWMSPVSYSNGLNTFYGTPWEIYRTTSILSYTARPVTLVTKGGNLPGYSTELAVVPDYGFAVTVLVAGNRDLTLTALEIVSTTIVHAADRIAHENLISAYTGRWSSTSTSTSQVNSSFEIAHSRARDGLYVKSWVSNGTDMLGQIGTGVYFPYADEKGDGGGQYLQAVPTLLFRDEEKQEGEVWRLLAHQVEDEDDEEKEMGGRKKKRKRNLFKKENCITDIDTGNYAGLPVNEIVFWDKRHDGTFGGVELTGFRIVLDREDKDEGASEDSMWKEEDERFVVQE